MGPVSHGEARMTEMARKKMNRNHPLLEFKSIHDTGPP
jgi:hypothetical protein